MYYKAHENPNYERPPPSAPPLSLSIFVSLYRLVSQPQCLSLIIPSFSVRYFQSISLVLTVRGWQISQV